MPSASNYTCDKDPCRWSVASPLAENVWWDVYSDGRGTLLVKMLFNEHRTNRLSKNALEIGRGQVNRAHFKSSGTMSS
jgi:hypothetical protein